MTATKTTTRTWNNLILETRTEYGSAARRNRGRHSGHKIHRLNCEYVIGVVDESQASGEVGHKFLKTGNPVLFSVWPACGCTQGQMAGLPYPKLTAEHVTCEKCLS